MDIEPPETHVYVHSPLVEYSAVGGYFTSYAIHLMSNNPCFSQPTSHIRRRYSEFSRLRELLASHHSSLTPPVLPPKNYFHRFHADFIEQRMEGLQKFLTEVLSIPVYLSDKSLHLFLQSSSSMSEIRIKCLGDIPAPPLLDSHVFPTPYSENGSQSNSSFEAQYCADSLHHLALNKKVQSQSKQINRTHDFHIPSSEQQVLTLPLHKAKNKPILMPKRNGSLDSSTGSSPSSPSSLETGYSSSSERAKDRHVSFNNTVKIAVVTHYGISVLHP